MEKLFGLDMNSIAGCLGSAFALVVGILALVAWRARVMFKLGLRPIPRRRAQSTLIVLGLMLATLIITAAFVTGDTLSHTIRSMVVEGLGQIDEIVRLGGGTDSLGARDVLPTYFKFARYEELSADLAGYEQVDMVMPAIRETIPAVNATRRRSQRALQVMALRPADAALLLAGEMRDAQGGTLALDDLGPYEAYINSAAAKALDANAGDELDLYTGPKPKTLVVRAIAADDKRDALLVLTLKQAQVLFNERGNINAILVSNSGDSLSGAKLSQDVTAYLRGLLADRAVAAELINLLAQDASAADALRKAAALREGNTQKDLLALADGLATRSLSTEMRSLLADEGLAAEVQNILGDAQWRSQAARDRLATMFSDLSELGVDDAKRDALDLGELAASAFTTIFVVCGLFSIAAGLLLIFLIFVMLAAERKSEMGMTRALGAQRSHLVQMFVFEGTAYDLAAAGVGVALGVLTGLVIAATLGRAFAGATDLVIRPNFTVRSLVVSYTLGMLVTFGTVLFSANRVSRLNIVAAIRDLPEPPPPPIRLRDRLARPFRVAADGFRQLRRWRVLRALWTWVVGVPLSLLRIVWAGFTSGPLTLLLGLVMLPAGQQSSSAAGYSLGASFIIIGGGLILRGLLAWPLKRRAGLADRLAFTLMGLGLAVFWSLPFNALESSLGIKDLKSGPEMFFISGTMLVAGAVMVVMYNTDLLLRLILGSLGGARRLAPVLRMAIAYPLSNRFRTGLTVAMFAIIVFSVIFMATLFKVNEAVFAETETLTGGFDLRAEASTTNPLPDLAGAIAHSPRLRKSDYPIVAAQSSLSVEMRQGAGQWKSYAARGVDAAYLDNVGYDMAVKAEGYATAGDVWRAVRDHPGYSVIDSFAIPSRKNTNIVIGGPEFRMKGVYIEDKTMPPITVQVREPRTKSAFEVIVIGVITQESFGGTALYTSQVTLDKAMPFPLTPATHFIRLAEGIDPPEAGRALESAFLKYGMQSIDQVAEIKDAQASQRVIEFLLQGFLLLGLIVGVAALGVISTRAVVERRQQIGMLRALGFRQEMVGWCFLIESSFVAMLGIGLGAGLALIPAYNMINDLASDLPGIRFQVPWGMMSIVVGLAYGMALLMTWFPARQASRVTPAEALRYE